MDANAADAVAIIGAGCRVPGASGVTEFWKLLIEGRDAVTEIPKERFDARRWYSPEQGKPKSIRSLAGGFLADVARFDADFFGVVPGEARQLDPQQRVLMEVTWEALEDAGQVADDLAGSNTGVYLCTANTGFLDQLRRAGHYGLQAVMGGEPGEMVAGRVAYHLDLRGPVVAVQSACATSLLAVHIAIRALRSGEIDLAIVGGANLHLTPDLYFGLSEADMLSPTGRCRFGDRAADGFVRSEGAVVLILKRMSEALSDGDRVYASVLGSATRSDGRSGGSITTPGVAGQTAMLRAAYADAGVRPADVDLVEAHGPGTLSGDPVELRALAEVLAEGRESGRPALIGSVKSNLGHLESVAGVTGMLKAALALRHRRVPATLHVTEPLELFDEPGMPLRLAIRNTPLEPNGKAATAGVSAFGLSGANVHVVLGEAPCPIAESTPDKAAAYVLPLSAKDSTALRTLAERTAQLLDAPDAPSLSDVCHSATQRRSHHGRRAAATGTNKQETIDALLGISGDADAGVAVAERPRVVFVFPGQGSQWPGMGRELLRTVPVFADRLSECDKAVQAELGWSPIALIESGAELTETSKVQPTLWAVQSALAATWLDWGVEPHLVMGHSMGEVAAAVATGALTVADGAAVICRRAALLAAERTPGAMWVVQLGEDEARAAIGDRADRVSVGVVNSPYSTVLSGEPAALDEIVEPLRTRGVFCGRVDVDYASHGPQMEPLVARVAQALSGIRPTSGRIPVHSTVTNAQIDGYRMDGGYWARNLRLPVRFADAVRAVLANQRPTLFVEISPHPVLHMAIEDCIEEASAEATTTIAGSLHRDQPELSTLYETLAKAYTLGCQPRWDRVNPPGRFVALPTYPWQGRRYWLQTPTEDTHEPKIPPRETRISIQSVEDCVAEVRRRVSTLLGIEDVDVDRPLTALGINSVFGSQLAYQLRTQLDTSVSVRELLQNQTIQELAHKIHDRLAAH